MKIFCSITLLFLLMVSLGSRAQSVVNAEYFFDSDPGHGNGTPIALTPSGGDLIFTTSIPVTSLSPGLHFVAIRIKETGGLWSVFESRGFYITNATADAANIVAAEYFFDADPGHGNGTAIAVTAGAVTNFTIGLPSTGLTPGFHFLAIRTKGANGQWGIFESRGFYITNATTDAANIVAAEYFFDADPGNGSGTAIPVTAGAVTNFTVSLPATGLDPGFHFLSIRTKGTDGKWGIFESRGFYITGAATDVPNIVAAEYFFDNDPGTGQAESISITPGAITNFTVNLPATGLDPGFHFLAIRVKGADGKWGLFESRGFYVSPTTSNAGNITAAEYFIDDTDPGEGNATPLTITTPGAVVTQLFDISLSGVATGAHTISIRVKDSDGIWSAIETQTFTVLTCTPPTAPVATGASRCNNGTVTLTATSGAIGTQVYRWYEDEVTTAILFTGASFTTPALTTTTDFFVSVYDPATLCESNRTLVTATVVGTAPPVLNISSVTICEGGFIKISAPTGFTSYVWSNGETTREILVTTSGDYTAIVGDGTCQSEPSAPASVIVSPRPAKPVVTVSGSTNLCDGATVTLTAPAGFTYLWSDGQAAQEITVSAAGSYSVVVTDGSNCPSDASDAIEVKAFTTPAKPVIEIFGSTTLCGTNTAALLAPSGFAVYQWSGGQTAQGITVSDAGSYSVVVGHAANCLSVASDVVTITTTGQPCSTTNINTPPSISAQTFSVQIEGLLQADLTPFISDPDNNLNFASLRVINNQTSRGVPAFIDVAYNLVVDYRGDPFTGTDRVTVEICDLANACAQGLFDIDVAGEVVVHNGLSPDGNGINDFMFVKYIDVIAGASQNKVTIFNRWGDVVFDIQNYNNTDRVFNGFSNKGSELPSGTYFYKIEFSGNLKPLTGFITLMR